MTNTRNVGASHRAAMINAAEQAAGFITKYSVLFAGYTAGLIAGPAKRRSPKRMAMANKKSKLRAKR